MLGKHLYRYFINSTEKHSKQSNSRNSRHKELKNSNGVGKESQENILKLCLHSRQT